jgi:hypothetical protein
MSAVKYIERKNGDKYPVRYDVNALCQFEDLTGGKSLLNGLADFDVRYMRALVYVGLACGHSFEEKAFKLSMLDVGKWDDLIKQVFPQCMKICREMMPQDEEGKDVKGEGKEPGE